MTCDFFLSIFRWTYQWWKSIPPLVNSIRVNSVSFFSIQSLWGLLWASKTSQWLGKLCSSARRCWILFSEGMPYLRWPFDSCEMKLCFGILPMVCAYRNRNGQCPQSNPLWNSLSFGPCREVPWALAHTWRGTWPSLDTSSSALPGFQCTLSTCL